VTIVSYVVFDVPKNIRRSWSGGQGLRQKAWAIAHENMVIGRNSSFMAVKCQKILFGHGRAVTMVPYVVFEVPKEY